MMCEGTDSTMDVDMDFVWIEGWIKLADNSCGCVGNRAMTYKSKLPSVMERAGKIIRK